MDPKNLTIVDVRDAATKFLLNYHSSQKLPVPIEEIVEFDLKIKLVVINGIKRLLGVDSFISADFSQITVDEESYDTYIARTRFSIAHEIGHYILHKEWYKKNGPKSIDDFLSFYDSLDAQTHKYLEIQANTFAGLILVPTENLKEEIKKLVGYVPEIEDAESLTEVIHDLPGIFGVSGITVLIRLQRERIVKQVNS